MWWIYKISQKAVKLLWILFCLFHEPSLPGTAYKNNVKNTVNIMQDITSEILMYPYLKYTVIVLINRGVFFWRKWREAGLKWGASQTSGPGCHICDPVLQFQSRTTARAIKKLLLILAKVLRSGRMCFCVHTCVWLCMHVWVTGWSCRVRVAGINTQQQIFPHTHKYSHTQIFIYIKTDLASVQTHWCKI